MFRIYGSATLQDITDTAEKSRLLASELKVLDKAPTALLAALEEHDPNTLFTRATFMGYDLPNVNGDGIIRSYAETYGPAYIGVNANKDHSPSVDDVVGKVYMTYHVEAEFKPQAGEKIIGRSLIPGFEEIVGARELQLKGITGINRSTFSGEDMARKVLAGEVKMVSQEADTEYCQCSVCQHRMSSPQDPNVCSHLVPGSKMRKAFKVSGKKYPMLAFRFHANPVPRAIAFVVRGAYSKADVDALVAGILAGYNDPDVLLCKLEYEESLYGETEERKEIRTRLEAAYTHRLTASGIEASAPLSEAGLKKMSEVHRLAYEEAKKLGDSVTEGKELIRLRALAKEIRRRKEAPPLKASELREYKISSANPPVTAQVEYEIYNGVPTWVAYGFKAASGEEILGTQEHVDLCEAAFQADVESGKVEQALYGAADEAVDMAYQDPELTTQKLKGGLLAVVSKADRTIKASYPIGALALGRDLTAKEKLLGSERVLGEFLASPLYAKRFLMAVKKNGWEKVKAHLDMAAAAWADSLKAEGDGLRSVRVTFADGDVIETNMAKGVTDEEIRKYYGVGKEFNVGAGGEDNLQKVAKVEILASLKAGEAQFPGPKGLKEGQTVEMDGKSYFVVNVGHEWIQLKDEATGDRLKVSHGDLAEDLEAGTVTIKAAEVKPGSDKPQIDKNEVTSPPEQQGPIGVLQQSGAGTLQSRIKAGESKWVDRSTDKEDVFEYLAPAGNGIGQVRHWKPEIENGKKVSWSDQWQWSIKRGPQNYTGKAKSKKDAMLLVEDPDKNKGLEIKASVKAAPSFDKWLDTFISEKGIDLEDTFDVEGPSGTNTMPYGVIIEHMKIAGPQEQKALKNKMVYLDFKNADIKDFLRHLGGAIAAGVVSDASIMGSFKKTLRASVKADAVPFDKRLELIHAKDIDALEKDRQGKAQGYKGAYTDVEKDAILSIADGLAKEAKVLVEEWKANTTKKDALKKSQELWKQERRWRMLVDLNTMTAAASVKAAVPADFKVGDHIKHDLFGEGVVSYVGPDQISVTWDNAAQSMLGAEPLSKEKLASGKYKKVDRGEMEFSASVKAADSTTEAKPAAKPAADKPVTSHEVQAYLPKDDEEGFARVKDWCLKNDLVYDTEDLPYVREVSVKFVDQKDRADNPLEAEFMQLAHELGARVKKGEKGLPVEARVQAALEYFAQSSFSGFLRASLEASGMEAAQSYLDPVSHVLGEDGRSEFSEDPHDPYAGRDTGENWEAEAKKRVADKDKTLTEATKDVQSWISKKIAKLVKEGKKQPQAAAIAYSMARKEGYKVPENPNLKSSVFAMPGTGRVRVVFPSSVMAMLEGDALPPSPGDDRHFQAWKALRILGSAGRRLKAGGGAGIVFENFEVADGGAGTVQKDGSVKWETLPKLGKFDARGYLDGMDGVRGNLLEVVGLEANLKGECKPGDKVVLTKIDAKPVWQGGWIRNEPKAGDVIDLDCSKGDFVFLVNDSFDAYAQSGDLSVKVTEDFVYFYQDAFNEHEVSVEDIEQHRDDTKTNYGASGSFQAAPGGFTVKLADRVAVQASEDLLAWMTPGARAYDPEYQTYLKAQETEADRLMMDFSEAEQEIADMRQGEDIDRKFDEAHKAELLEAVKVSAGDKKYGQDVHDQIEAENYHFLNELLKEIGAFEAGVKASFEQTSQSTEDGQGGEKPMPGKSSTREGDDSDYVPVYAGIKASAPKAFRRGQRIKASKHGMGTILAAGKTGVVVDFDRLNGSQWVVLGAEEANELEAADSKMVEAAPLEHPGTCASCYSTMHAGQLAASNKGLHLCSLCALTERGNPALQAGIVAEMVAGALNSFVHIPRGLSGVRRIISGSETLDVVASEGLRGFQHGSHFYAVRAPFPSAWAGSLTAMGSIKGGLRGFLKALTASPAYQAIPLASVKSFIRADAEDERGEEIGEEDITIGEDGHSAYYLGKQIADVGVDGDPDEEGLRQELKRLYESPDNKWSNRDMELVEDLLDETPWNESDVELAESHIHTGGGTIPNALTIEDAVAKWMVENQYFPDVWTVSDHGNINNVTADVMKNCSKYEAAGKKKKPKVRGSAEDIKASILEAILEARLADASPSVLNALDSLKAGLEAKQAKKLIASKASMVLSMIQDLKPLRASLRASMRVVADLGFAEMGPLHKEVDEAVRGRFGMSMDELGELLQENEITETPDGTDLEQLVEGYGGIEGYLTYLKELLIEHGYSLDVAASLEARRFYTVRPRGKSFYNGEFKTLAEATKHKTHMSKGKPEEKFEVAVYDNGQLIDPRHVRLSAKLQGESFPSMRPGRLSPNLSEPGGYVGPGNDCNYADLPMPGLQGPDPDPETLTHDRLWDGTLLLDEKQSNTIQYSKTTGSGYMH